MWHVQTNYAAGKWFDYIFHQTQLNYTYRTGTCRILESPL